jgi:hypothetical protein
MNRVVGSVTLRIDAAPDRVSRVLSRVRRQTHEPSHPEYVRSLAWTSAGWVSRETRTSAKDPIAPAQEKTGPRLGVFPARLQS